MAESPEILGFDSSGPRIDSLCSVFHCPDLQFQAPPPPPDMMGGFDDFLAPLPPPVDYDSPAPPNINEKVVALYSYNSGNPGDLAFEKGDIIYVTKRNEDGWCEGVLHGAEGYFPGNYVESTS